MRERILITGILFFLSGQASLATEQTVSYLPIRAIPTSLDPSELKVDSASYLFRQLAEGLFAIGDGFQIYPRLASNLEWSADQKKLNLKLRPAKFSDGTPVDAASVINSLSYCIRNAEKTLLVAVRAIEGYNAFVSSRKALLTGITAKGDQSIEIRLSKKSPLLLDDLAQADCHIVKPSSQGSMDLLKGAVGSGPYRLKSVNKAEITLEKSLSYGVPISGPDVGVFRVTKDFGNFDRLKSWVTMAALEYRAGPDSDFTETESSELGTHQLIFNNAKPPFNNVNLRRAVALSLDWELLAKNLSWSVDTLQAGLIPLGMAGFKRRTLADRSLQIKEARALLEKLGFTDKRPFRFKITLSDLPVYEKEVTLWPKLFGGVPIEGSTEVLPHAERNLKQDRGDFQAMRVMKFAGSIEAHRVLSSYMSQSNYNPTKSHEPGCDHLISESIGAPDRDIRQGLYEKADHCLIAERSILVPLASIQPGFVYLKKPWRLSRTNRYLLYPYWISEWRR